MISAEELEILFDETFSDCNTFNEELIRAKELTGEHTDSIRNSYCNNLLYAISRGYTKYTPQNFNKDELIQGYLEIAKLLPQEHTYFHAVYFFFKQDHKKCLSLLEDFVKSIFTETDTSNTDDCIMDEPLFIDMFFEPFKQAFPGFWTSLATILCNSKTQNGIPELCKSLETYYTCKTDEEALDLLINMMQEYPDLILVKELAGYTYYSMKMWNNAIAYFESVEDTSIFFPKDNLYFMLAWCNGKIKNHITEELYYKKAEALAPNNPLTLNNLGYSLYTQKKYQESITYFKRCLEIDSSYIYASNNYVRALIALGRNKDAKAFVKSGEYKISKDILKRVEKLDNSNARLKKETVQEVIELVEDSTSQENIAGLGIKRQQFSNEKLLEDELTARIESGTEVFGMKLKMYKRKGVYGRQFIIPIGRLDLLCEDDKGNLYIIELKKDSGYDDAYQQTANYLDWFEKNEISQGKNVYGIICLNSPTKELIDKVHTDKRMRLFEYQISYTEI